MASDLRIIRNEEPLAGHHCRRILRRRLCAPSACPPRKVWTGGCCSDRCERTMTDGALVVAQRQKEPFGEDPSHRGGELGQ
jgi:hypothetical protein